MSEPTLDISVIGAGLWNAIHHTAALCDIRNDGQAFFRQWIISFVQTLPCKECREHATRYIKENDPDEESSFSVWAWKFHNTVTTRIGKKRYPFVMVQAIWLQGHYPTCTDCGHN